MTGALTNAPGCIGSPTIRRMQHPLCETCSYRKTCGDLSDKIANRIARQTGVDLGDVTRADMLTSKEPGLAKSSTRLAETLRQNNIGRAMLRQAVAGDKRALARIEPKWFRKVVMAICLRERVSKTAVVQMIAKDNGWKEKTARSHVATAFDVLKVAGLVDIGAHSVSRKDKT